MIFSALVPTPIAERLFQPTVVVSREDDEALAEEDVSIMDREVPDDDDWQQRTQVATTTEVEVIIVTDGAVDLPEWLQESPAIRKVSGRLWLGNDPLPGGTDRFCSLVRDHHYPSKTPPTVSDLTEAHRHHDLVISLHVLATLSATVSHAREAAARAGPGAIVIDTRSFSVGAGLASLPPFVEPSRVAGTPIDHRLCHVASGAPLYVRTHTGDRDASERLSLRFCSPRPLGQEPPSPPRSTRKGHGARQVKIRQAALKRLNLPPPQRLGGTPTRCAWGTRREPATHSEKLNW